MVGATRSRNAKTPGKPVYPPPPPEFEKIARRNSCRGADNKSEEWRSLVTAADFVVLTHFYRPAGLLHEKQPWLATVYRQL